MSYVAADLATWLGKQNTKHVRGATHHPMTQGKIERWHQAMKNRILLENYFLPGDLQASIGRFVDHYNYGRYHESLGNLTPVDVYTGQGQAILERRDAIKCRTIVHRRLLHQQSTAWTENPDAPQPTLATASNPHPPDDTLMLGVRGAIRL